MCDLEPKCLLQIMYFPPHTKTQGKKYIKHFFIIKPKCFSKFSTVIQMINFWFWIIMFCTLEKQSMFCGYNSFVSHCQLLSRFKYIMENILARNTYVFFITQRVRLFLSATLLSAEGFDVKKGTHKYFTFSI